MDALDANSKEQIMRALSVDISGRVEKYDHALFDSMCKNLSDDTQMVFACPYFTISKNAKPLRLFSFVPERYRSCTNFIKRLLKVLEVIFNYHIIQKYVQRESIQVLHLQWLPLLDFCLFEKYWIKHLLKKNQELKIILTIHNVYPHDINIKKKIAYRNRMLAIAPYISHYIVHTTNTMLQIEEEFHICENNISVIQHGIFIPASKPARKRDNDKIRLLMYGKQFVYKGTDLFVKAIELLSPAYRQQIEAHIIGLTEKQLIDTYLERAQHVGITWKNCYLSDAQLYQALQDADVLIFPYRSISQSGALLLGIDFKKPIILSDIPSFKETMGTTYPDSLYFKSNDANSLSETIANYLEHADKYNQQVIPVLQHIIDENSWDCAANKTLTLYKKINEIS